MKLKIILFRDILKKDDSRISINHNVRTQVFNITGSLQSPLLLSSKAQNARRKERSIESRPTMFRSELVTVSPIRGLSHIARFVR